MLNAYIICYNNGWLVRNTVRALRKLQVKPVVVDNCSTGKNTEAILSQLEQDGVEVVRCDKNYGYRVVYDYIRPEQSHYIITDPDLDLDTLPEDTISQLISVCDASKAHKVGLALDISKPADILEGVYFRGSSIIEWERRFWTVPNTRFAPLEVYEAPIDTTFCLVCQLDGHFTEQYRVAGPYTVRHLPWHKSWIDAAPQDDLLEYVNTTNTNNDISTTSKLIQQYRSSTLAQVTKNDVTFKVWLSNVNKDFWQHHYQDKWEADTFEVFDRYANKESVMVDIGAWIGPTVCYNAHKFKHVIAVEADRYSIEELKRNLKSNDLTNVTIVPRAVYHENTTVYFGKNKFRSNAQENDSTSQIQGYREGCYAVSTVTLLDLVKDLPDIALIKVDIEGGEEYILEDLLNYYLEHRETTIHLSFHYSWWSNKDRLDILSPLLDLTGVPNIVMQVKQNPFCSIVLPSVV